MEIRHLRLIDTVAEDGSLTRAAEKLFLSQSALSHQLKEVESQLKTSLFHRVNKKLVLTDAGKIVLKSARTILCELEQAELEVKRSLIGETGKVRICTECYTCYNWLPPIMKRFHYCFPNVELEINTENTLNPLELVLSGKLDVAVVHGKTEDKNLEFTKLYTDQLMAVVPENHPWTGQKYVELKQFASEVLFTHSKSFKKNSSMISRALSDANVKPKKVTYIQITEAIVEMIKSGLGVAVMGGWIMKHYVEHSRIQLIPITKKGMYRDWYAVRLKNNDKKDFTQCFIDLLENEVNIS
ncbi:MAG: LysR family transcriptional regulator [Calditrichaeota bacterium]|nr:LysR family transcriptional regulator [Calditrichota bacterium]